MNWGRQYLMCPPGHFGVLYEINPWMHQEVQADAEVALAQWQTLVDKLKSAGAEIELINPEPGLPDMVFTANAGVIDGQKFAASSFAHPQRAGEEPFFRKWFADRNYEIIDQPPGTRFEGAGDALPFNGSLVAGYRIRSDFAAHTHLAEALRIEVVSVELVDPRLYHIDLTFCPLNDHQALIAPMAWDTYGRAAVAKLVEDPIELTEDETLAFCANSVVVGTQIVMPSCTKRLERELSTRGFDIDVCDLSEFQKAGGASRCLTLALDVTF